MSRDFQIAIHSMKFLGSLSPKELQSEKGPIYNNNNNNNYYYYYYFILFLVVKFLVIK
jgi:hypothetical protein